MPVGPVVIVNGPIRQRHRHELAACNVLGQGNRANVTIGRALQLVIRNVGGGRPGERRPRHARQPGQVTFCFAEDEEGSPWEPLAGRARLRRRARRRSRCSPARARAASSTSSSRDARVAGAHVRRVPAHGRTTRSCRSASTPSSSSAPSTPACSREAGWTESAAASELDELAAARRAPRSSAAPAASPRACPSASRDAHAAEVPARRAADRARRRRRRPVLGHHRRLGER